MLFAEITGYNLRKRCGEWQPISTNSQTGPTSVGTQKALAKPLAAVRHQQGRLIGRMEALGFPLRAEAVLQTLTEEVLKSSEIEGEMLDREQVRSSIARRLGMDIGALAPTDRNVEGVVEMMLDATEKLRTAAHRGAAVRLACRAVSDRTQRHDQNQRRRLARRQARPDAGRVGSDRQRARPLSKRRPQGVSSRK